MAELIYHLSYSIWPVTRFALNIWAIIALIRWGFNLCSFVLNLKRGYIEGRRDALKAREHKSDKD